MRTAADKHDSVQSALIKMPLLTGQPARGVGRHHALAGRERCIRRRGLFPAEAREKGNARRARCHAREAALEVIRSRPRFGYNRYIFTGRTTGPSRNFYTGKERFDAEK